VLYIEDFDYHSLRHTHATFLLEKGAPLKYIQQRLGPQKDRHHDKCVSAFNQRYDSKKEYGI